MQTAEYITKFLTKTSGVLEDIVKDTRYWLQLFVIVCVFAVLLGIARTHFLLFHTFVELLGVTVAGCVFLLVWSVRRVELPAFFLVVGMGQGFVALFGLLHLLSFEGFHIVGDGASGVAYLLKSMARLIDAAALVAGAAINLASITFIPVFAAFSAATVLFLGSFFFWPSLPESFDGAFSFTALINSATLLAYIIGIHLLWRRRAVFSPRVLRYLLIVYGLSFLSTLLIGSRSDIYDLKNGIGHLASLTAYAILARAIILTTFREPADTLLRHIYKREKERNTLLRRLSVEKERYHALIAQSREALAVVDGRSGQVLEINRPMTELIGYTMEMIRGIQAFSIVEMSQAEIDSALQELKEKGVLLPAIRNIRHADGHLLRLERMVSCIEAGEEFLFLYSLRELSDERRRQELITSEVEYAGFLQRAMQPARLRNEWIEIRTLWEPLHGVSGDAISYKWLPEQKRLVGYVMDVTGHGIATALQTATLRALIDRELSRNEVRSQADILRRLNTDAAAYFHEGSFAALILFDLDLRRGLLKCAGAGIYEFIASSGEYQGIVQLPGSFLGIMRDVEFGFIEISLQAGDKFYFYTDGVADQLGQAKIQSQPQDFAATCEQLNKLALHPNRRDDAAGLFIEVRRKASFAATGTAKADPALPSMFQQFHEQILRISSQQGVDDTLQCVIMAALAVTGADLGQIQVYNASQDVMETRVAVGSMQRDLLYNYRRGEYLVGRVWEAGSTILIEDYRKWEYGRHIPGANQIFSIVGLPLFLTGTVLGVLSVGFTYPGRGFKPEHIWHLEMFCQAVVRIVEHKLLLDAQEKELSLFRRSVYSRFVSPCSNNVNSGKYDVLTEDKATAEKTNWLNCKVRQFFRGCSGDSLGYTRVFLEPDQRFIKGLVLGAASAMTLEADALPECPMSIARRAIEIWEETYMSLSLREQAFAIHRGLKQRTELPAAITIFLFCLDRQERILQFAAGGIKTMLAVSQTLQGVVPLRGNSLGSSELPMIYEQSISVQNGDSFSFQPGIALRMAMEGNGFNMVDFTDVQQRLTRAFSQMPHGVGAIMLEIGDERPIPIEFEFRRIDQWDVIRKRMRRHLVSHIGEAATKMEIALGEAVSNALRFGPETGIPLVNICMKRRVTSHGSHYAVIRVRHSGRPFDGNVLLKKIAMYGEDYFRDILEQDSGRGLALMKASVDRVVYNATGNEVLLFKRAF